MAQLRHHLEVLLPRQEIVDGGELAGQADRTLHADRVVDQVVTGDPRGSLVRPHQSGQDPHHRGLARSIWAEQGEHGPRLDGEVHTTEHAMASERLRDSRRINCVFHTQNSIWGTQL
jgi:hypothetical protein